MGAVLRRLGAGLLAGILAVTAEAAVREQRYLGYATDLKSGEYLYTEVHRHRYDGDRWLGGDIRYVAPDGRLLGEKTLDFSQDPYVPLTRYKLALPVYGEAITAVSGTSVQMEKLADGKRRTETLKRQGAFAADSGFNAFIVDNLPALRGGETRSLSLGVIGRLDQYRFRIRKAGERLVEGEAAVQLSVEPDSLLRYVVDPLKVTYGLATRLLLAYEGVSNVINPATDKVYTVRIVYPRKAPANVPAAVLALQP